MYFYQPEKKKDTVKKKKKKQSRKRKVQVTSIFFFSHDPFYTLSKTNFIVTLFCCLKVLVTLTSLKFCRRITSQCNTCESLNKTAAYISEK